MKIEATDRTLEFGTRRIAYRLWRTDRKRLRISVLPSLEVQVAIPSTVDEDELTRLLAGKAPWIARQLDRMAAFHPLPSPTRYISGETFLYLGRQYRLKVEPPECPETKGRARPPDAPPHAKHCQASARLIGRFLTVTVPEKATQTTVRRAVQHWYADRATEIFPARINHCHAIASRHGVPLPVFSLRQMRTRWGSCTASKHVTLNANLLKVPVHCLDYVIMHELCHLMHHNHSPAFYRLLATCMPDWRKRKEILDQIAMPTQTRVPSI
jgi:predicted metal-dependent hydrolase